MRIRSNNNLLHASDRSAKAYQNLTKAFVDRLSIFKTGFSWYLCICSNDAAAKPIGSAREEIKILRDIVKTPEAVRSSAKCAFQAKKFLTNKTPKQALQLVVAGSEAIGKGSALALMLKKIGMMQLMFRDKDLSGVISSTRAACELASSAYGVGKNMHRMPERYSQGSAWLDMSISILSMSISLSAVCFKNPGVNLVLKTMFLVEKLVKEQFFRRNESSEKIFIPYLTSIR